MSPNTTQIFRIQATGPGFSPLSQTGEQVPVVSNLRHLQYTYLLVTETDHVTAPVGQGKTCLSLTSKHLSRCVISGFHHKLDEN